MDVIEKLLTDLHGSIESRDSYANSVAIVASIESVALGEIDSLELDICSNLFFSSTNPPSLLEYIIQTARFKDREVIKAKVSALKFIAQFLKTYPEQTDIHGAKITLILIDSFKKEESGEVKAALLLPLKNIFRCRLLQWSRVGGADDADFQGQPLNPVLIKLEQTYLAILDELRYGKKLTKGVICESLKLLGILVGAYALEQSTVQYVPIIINLCNQTLKENFKPSCKDPDFPAIAGSFSCLDRIFFHYEENCDNSSELWKYLLQTVQTVNSPDVSKFAAAGKAVRLIKNHAGLFQNLIGLNASQSYAIIMAAHKSEKTAVLKHSGDALSALMTQISSYLVDQTSQSKLKSKCEGNVMDSLNTISSLVDNYLMVLQDASRTDTEEVYLTLKGIMNCASSLPRVFLLSNAKESYNPLSIISSIISSARHSELLAAVSANTTPTEGPSGSITQFSSQKKSLYLGAVVSVIFALFLDGIKDSTKQYSFVSAVTNSNVQLFLDEYLTMGIIGYVKLWKKQQPIVQSSLLKLLYICFYGHNEAANDKVERILSEETIIPLHHIQDCLFQTLLARTATRKESDENLNVDSTRISEYTGEVDDRLLYGYLSLWLELTKFSDKATKLQILQTYGPSVFEPTTAKILNLTFQHVMQMIKDLDLGYVKADDLNIQDVSWIPKNIVDQDLLININSFFAIFIKQQQKIQVAYYLDGFLDEIILLANDHPLVSSFYKLIVSIVEHVEEHLRKHGNQVLSLFVLELQNKVQNNPFDFRGELLDSALKLILSIPFNVVSLDALVPSLRLSLLTGSNVVLAIQQLTRIVVSSGDSAAPMYLSELIPLTAVYLERFAHGENGKMKTSPIDRYLKEDDDQINLQTALLEFLGRIGGMNKLILQNPSSAVQESLVWTSAKVLDMAVSTTDIDGKSARMNLNLDDIFINVNTLCMKWIISGKDDQSLMSCAEALHSLFLVLIGNASVTKRQKDSAYAPFFKNAFPVILKLGSKTLRCQKMFEVLLFQSIRWFSGEGNVHDDEAAALLEVLFDSLSNEEIDHSERDLASRGLEEYFSWSIKQSTRDIKANNRINIFMSKVITMLSHPLRNFRRGGVIALSKIYKNFREEHYLVSRYSMQLIMLLLNTSKNGESENSQENEQIIYKYEEILALSIAKRGWMSEMITASDDRVFPTCLGELVKWLWDSSITSSEKIFRRCCMRCFITFSPLLKSCTSSEFKQSTLHYIEKWAKDEGHANVLAGVHTLLLNDMNGTKKLLAIEVALDVYTWIFTLELVHPKEILKPTKSLTILDQIPQLLGEFVGGIEKNRHLLAHELQVLYRYIIWLQTLLKKTDPMKIQEAISFLRIKMLWSEDCLQLILHALSLLEVGRKGESSEIIFEDFLGATRHLLKFFAALEPDLESSACGQLLRGYVTKLLENVPKFGAEDLILHKEVQRTNLILNMVITNELDVVVFGSNFNIVKQAYIDSIYRFILNRIHGVEDRLIEQLFEICVNLGLQWSECSHYSPIFSQSTASASDTTLSSTSNIALVTILNSNFGSLVLRKTSKVIVASILRSNSNLTFTRNTNIVCLLDLFRSANSNAVFLLEAVLLELSSRLSNKMDQAYIDLYLINLLPALQIFGFQGLPDSVLTTLLTIDAQIGLLTSSAVSKFSDDFVQFIIEDCLQKLQSSNKFSVEVLRMRLTWLPYILPGTAAHSPRGLGKQDSFPEEKAIESLEEFVSLKFPLDSKELNPTSEKGKDYLSLLETYLTSLEQCGSVVLLKPLLSSFREGSNHRYYSRLCQAIKSVAGSVALPTLSLNAVGIGKEFAEVQALCNFCIDLMLDSLQDFIVKRTFFDLLFLPTLSKLTSKHIARLFSAAAGANGGLQLSREHSQQTLVKTMYEIVAKEASLSIVEDEFEVKGKLYLQIACFKILGFLYDHCSLSDLKGTLTQSYVGSETVSGKELTQALCKIAFKVSKSATPITDERYKDLLLELQGTAYECLMITVSKTQSDEQFFDTFLFKVKPGEDLWNRVTYYPQIGDSPVSFFSVMSGIFPTQRLGWEKSFNNNGVDRKISALRKMTTKAKVSAGKGGFLSQYLNNSMLGTSSISQSQIALPFHSTDVQENGNLGNYSQSQYLNEDINLVDIASLQRSYSVPGSEEAMAPGWDDHAIFLEMNHLNSTPIMGTMVRVITRMNKLFAEKWKSSTNIPFWLQEMRTRLTDRMVCQRVRLFALRLLMNQPVAEILKPWIQELLPSILDCTTEELCVPHSGSKNSNEGNHRNLHYFLRDLVFLFCDTWKDGVPNSMSCYQAGKLVNFLLDNILDDEGPILKENTAAVCTLIKHWINRDSADMYNLSLKSIVEMISMQGSFTGGSHARASSKGTIAVRARLAGLELLQTLLESDYNVLLTDEASALLGALISCVNFPRKEVMESSCIVCGFLLQKRNELEKSYRVTGGVKATMDSLHNQLVQIIEHQLTQKFGADLMASSLRSLTMSYPQFLTRELIMKTLHCFPQLKFRQRYLYLDAMIRTSFRDEDLKITDLLKPYYKSLLTEVSAITFGRGSVSIKLPVVQLATILLLTKYRKELSIELIMALIGDSEADGLRLCVNQKSNLQARDAAYQLLMLLLIDHPHLSTKVDPGLTEEAQQVCRKVKGKLYFLLLNGLTDADDNGMDVEWTTKHEVLHTSIHYEDPKYWSTSGNPARIGVRRRLLEFFNFDFGLSNVLSSRLLVMMSDFLDPNNSESWLKYSSFLTLILFVSNSAANAPLFNNGLGNAQNSAARDILVVPQFLTNSNLSSATPMFALERTTQSLSQLVASADSNLCSTQSQAVGLSAILSQGNMAATQSFMNRRSGSTSNGSRSMIRGTQQYAWTQTQSQSTSTGTQLAEPISGLQGFSASRNSGAQFGTYRWTQSQQQSDGNPAKSLDSSSASASSSQIPINYNDMPPPPNLPSYIINQRVPTRINTSMMDSEGSKNYAMFRKVQVAKKLRNEEDNLNRRKVTFYRRYKTGELPDICIQMTDLMVPLASVCLLHSGLSAHVLHSLLISLYTQNQEFQPKLLSASVECFNRLKGHSGNATFVSLLLKQLNSFISIGGNIPTSGNPNLKIILDLVSKDSIVADLACESGNYYNALSLLEDLVSVVNKSLSVSSPSTFANSSEAQPAAKRKRVVRTKTTSSHASSSTSGSMEDSDAIANDLFDNGGLSSSGAKVAYSQPGFSIIDSKMALTPLWGQLLRVYDDLEENEIMMSITMKAVGDHSKAQTLKNALDAELRGDYLDAIDIYTSLLEASHGSEEGQKKRSFDQVSTTQSSTDGDSTFERGLWFDRSLSCHNKLADWGKLHDFISSKGIESMVAMKEEANGAGSLKRGRFGGHGQTSLLDELCLVSNNDRSRSLKERLIPQYFRSLLNSLPFNYGSPEYEDSSNAVQSKISGFVEKMLNYHKSSKDGSGSGFTGSNKNWFEESCSFELAVSSVLRSDWSKVKLYSDLAYQSFLRKWSTLHPCAFQARQKLLLRLEEILEVRDIATVKMDKMLPDESLVTVWSATEPSMSDPLSHWTNIALVRQIGLSSANSTINPANNLHMAKLYVRSAVASVHQGVLSMVKPLLEKNSILRKPVFGKKMVLTMDEVLVVSQYTHKSILRKALDSPEIPALFQKANGLLQKKVELLDGYAQILEENKKIDVVGNQLLINEKYQVLMMKAEWSSFAARYEQDKLLSGNSLAATLAGVNEDSVKDKKLATMDTYFSAINLVKDGSSNGAVTALSSWRESCFSTVAQYADQLLGELEQGQFELSFSQIAERKIKLEELCANNPILTDILKSRKKARDGSTFKSTELVAILTVYLLLEGLKYGSSFCSERILRLVNIVETYSDLLQDYFFSSLKDIPSWVFLRYSAQMLGGLDRPEGKVVAAILESVAQEYPQALYYSYRITSENFGKQGRYLSSKLDKLLANKHVDALIEALTGLTHPELRWSDGMKELEGRCKVYFGEGNTKLSNKDKAELGNNILGLFDSIKKVTIEQSWEKVGTKIGRYNMKWAKQIKGEVQSILGKDDNKLLSSKAIVEKLKALSNKSDPTLSTGKVDLQEFSQWLVEYSDVNGSKLALEIPGQYAKYIKSKPAVDTHEFIAGFDSKILVMASIRKPKRVKIFGHLGNETFFLVKGGEDLRNDERIEQLFMLMNYVLDNKLSPNTFASRGGMGKSKSIEELVLLGKDSDIDQYTEFQSAQNLRKASTPCHHGLSAKTYTVIPMSTKCGMLEWVKNTIPLKSIISEELAKDKDFLLANPNCLESEYSVDLSRIAAYTERMEWIGSHKTPDYHKCFKSATREQAWQVFSSITAKTPSDLLKRYFKRLAMNAEAFFTLRTEFAKSLAVCSIFGYILGMGDRHLDNLLIDMKTGCVVQIDFGICFGIGSSMLPVPELIPFRLTPVLRDVLQPLDSLALLRQYMVKVLQCLRNDAIGSGNAVTANSTKANGNVYNGVIGNALEIYINDPVIDWLRGITAKDKDELEAQKEAIESSGKTTWEPTRRVRIAVRKLKGEDPISLLLEDLKVNTAVATLDSYKALHKILQAVRANVSLTSGSTSYASCSSKDASIIGLSGPTGSIAWGDSMLSGLGMSNNESGVNDNDPSRSKSIPVHEQVDLLIKLATDPDILARQWTGLQTWL